MWPGIGRLTAVALAGAGWNVTLTGRRRDALAETVKLCSSNSERCLIVAGNITNEQFVEQLFEDTVGHFGRLDLLFNARTLSLIADQLSSIFSALLGHYRMLESAPRSCPLRICHYLIL